MSKYYIVYNHDYDILDIIKKGERTFHKTKYGEYEWECFSKVMRLLDRLSISGAMFEDILVLNDIEDALDFEWTDILEDRKTVFINEGKIC